MLLQNVRSSKMAKSDEEKLHSLMLNEEFWGVDVDEESGVLVYGHFKHVFKCIIAKYVSAAWKVRNALAHPSEVA